MTDQSINRTLVQLLHGSSWCTMASLIVRASFVLIPIILARSLGTAGLGEYGIILAFISVLVTSAAFGGGSATVKVIAGSVRVGGKLSSEVLWAVVVAGAGTAALLTLVGVASGGWIASLYGAESHVVLFQLGALGAGLLALGHTGGNVLLGLKRYREYALSVAFPAVLSLPVTLVLARQLGVKGAVIAFIVVAACQAMFAGVIVWNKWREMVVPQRMGGAQQTLRELLSISIPSSILNIAIAGMLWLTQTLLVVWEGTEALGFFRVALAIQSALLLVPLGIGITSLPLMSEAHETKGAESLPPIINTNLHMSHLFVLPAAAFLVFAAGPFVTIVYGTPFAAASAAVAVMGIAALPMAISNVIGQALIATGSAWTLLLLTAWWMASLVGLTALLVPPLASDGLALAYLGAYLIHIIVLVSSTRRFVCWNVRTTSLWTGTLLFLAASQWLPILDLSTSASLAAGSVAGCMTLLLVWRLYLIY